MRGNRNQFPLSFIDTDAMVEESISFIREHEPPEGYYLGFSGGKDSIVTKELMRMSGVQFQSFYSCTRIDPPEVVKFILDHHKDVTFLPPKMTFWQGIVKKGPPLRRSRWCCDVLKKDPGKDHCLKNRCMGIRAEESTRRADRPRVDFFKKYKQTINKPIFFWNEYHVWDFIEKQSLPYPSLYDQGFHRLGCVICPFIFGVSPGQIRQRTESMRRWPGIWKALKNSCHKWWSTKEHKGKYAKASFEQWYDLYLNGFEK